MSVRWERTTRLRFSADAAFYATERTWHPNQKEHFNPDGSFVATLPFTKEELQADHTSATAFYGVTVVVVFKDGSITTAQRLFYASWNPSWARDGHLPMVLTVDGSNADTPPVEWAEAYAVR